jgi:hypothetical protein
LLVASVKLVPALRAGAQDSGRRLLLFSRINIGIAELIREHFLYLALGVLVLLFLLEWRAKGWPRYRRAVIGVTAFVLNSTVLIWLFLIIVTAVLVAEMAMHPVK